MQKISSKKRSIFQFSLKLRISNFGSSPATVGIKNGADLGTFGGSLGLFLF
jgi:hypothetical protein